MGVKTSRRPTISLLCCVLLLVYEQVTNSFTHPPNYLLLAQPRLHTEVGYFFTDDGKFDDQSYEEYEAQHVDAVSRTKGLSQRSKPKKR